MKVIFDNSGIPRDEQGNEVYPVIVNMLCPVQHSDEARALAANHVVNVEGIYAQASQLLHTNLGPVGTNQITHIGSTQRTYTNILSCRIDSLNKANLPWIGTREYTVADDPKVLKSLFCCVTGDPISIMNHLKLDVIK